MHFFIFRCFTVSNQTFHQNAIQFSRLAKTFVEMKLTRRPKIICWNGLGRSLSKKFSPSLANLETE